MILPSKTNLAARGIFKEEFSDNIVLGTTSGLLKQINEDIVGLLDQNPLRFSIADGHWGTEASREVVEYWLSTTQHFPHTRQEAIHSTKVIEETLFNHFGSHDMDPESDLTSEASFITAELETNRELHFVSYGDCRMYIIRNDAIEYKADTNSTWLGAFSRLGLRQRISVENALIYQTVTVQKDDLILFFSDGVDECIYETPTLKDEEILTCVSRRSVSEIFDALMEKIFRYGAEDNASLIIVRVP